MKHITLWMLIFGLNTVAVDGWAKVKLKDQQLEAAVRSYFKTGSARVAQYSKDKKTVLKIGVLSEAVLSALMDVEADVRKEIEETDVKGLIKVFEEKGYQLTDVNARGFLGFEAAEVVVRELRKVLDKERGLGEGVKDALMERIAKFSEAEEIQAAKDLLFHEDAAHALDVVLKEDISKEAVDAVKPHIKDLVSTVRSSVYKKRAKFFFQKAFQMAFQK